MVGSGTHKKVLLEQNGEEVDQADGEEDIKDSRPASRNSKLRSNTQNGGTTSKN